MEHRSSRNGSQTFWEHWGILLNILVAAVFPQVLTFFTNLGGNRWISFLIVSQVLLISNAALIAYAKIPVYRRGQIFTFGPRFIPQNWLGYYQWGWRIFLAGVVLSLGLLLSRPPSSFAETLALKIWIGILFMKFS